MKLRFYAKGDALVPIPGQGLIHGALLNYVGRSQSKRETGLKDSDGNALFQAAFPATESGYECDSESAEARELKRTLLVSERMGDVSLYCADEQTASFVAVPFTPVEFKDGAWSAVTTKTKGSK